MKIHTKKIFDDEEEIKDLNDESISFDDRIDDQSDDPEDDCDEKAYTGLYARDKIFDNDFNLGNYDYEVFDTPSVEEMYASENLDECYDSFEYNRRKKLEMLIHEYFNESDIDESIKNKRRISKQSMPYIYMEIRKKMNTNEYSPSEIFMTMADYFGINYEIFYDNLPFVYKEELVKEMDEKHGILKKRKIKKLF